MADIVTQILMVAAGLLILILIGVVIFVINMERKYKHRAIIKDPNNKANRVLFDKFKIFTDKDGISWYRFRKLKKVVPPLPPECIEGDTKGRLVGTWYRIDSENFIPGKDDYENVDEEAFLKSVKPFKTEQRALTIAQYKKAERDRKKSWQDVIQQAIPYFVIVVLITLMLIFVPDVMVKRGEIDAAADARLQETVDALVIVTGNLDRVINDRGLLVQEQTSISSATNEGTVSVEAPN